MGSGFASKAEAISGGANASAMRFRRRPLERLRRAAFGPWKLHIMRGF